MTQQLIDNLCKQGYHSIDNFLPQEIAENLHQESLRLHERKLFTAANIGRLSHLKLAQDIRRDSILWLEEDNDNSNLDYYFSRIKQLSSLINQELFLNLQEFEAHYSIYQPNSYYKKHIDQFKNKKTRQISCVYYLNKDWQLPSGGELRLYDEQDNFLAQIEPQWNRFICFRSHLPHEVLTTFTKRMSIAGWLKTLDR